MNQPFVMAGIPTLNQTLYWKIRFLVGDPVAILDLPQCCQRKLETMGIKKSALFAQSSPVPSPLDSLSPAPSCSYPETSSSVRLLILRDVEMERAAQQAHTDFIACPADFAPSEGLSGDRETATAQSVAEALSRLGIDAVGVDRSFPMIFGEMIRRRGVSVTCDINYGVLERRAKDAEEILRIREAQSATEAAMTMACQMVAGAQADPDGILWSENAMLTSERVRAAIDHFLLDLGYANVPSIVAGMKDGHDCHHAGTGALRTGEPVIIDIFPQNKSTCYHGDCTRTSCHGTIQPIHQRMHEAVRAAKAAATASIRAGVTGESVHRVTIQTLEQFGFGYAAPGSVEAKKEIRLTHGTGHGLGLSVHEPPLLDFGGPELLPGDVVSVEPGLYGQGVGGIRIEDIVVVTETGCENLGRPISESLCWNVPGEKDQ